ncbi:MAG: hypothetical protein JXQ65_11710 [Candidatus Marinimicrobia bacterium]|nr:hypothetical protein [Candidatus Neomarinimicrobiota bacterium]
MQKNDKIEITRDLLNEIIRDTIFESIDEILNDKFENIFPTLCKSIQSKSSKQYFTYEELSYYTGLSKRKIAELKKNNQIPYQTIQGSTRFNKTLIDLWMLNNGSKTTFTSKEINRLKSIIN